MFFQGELVWVFPSIFFLLLQFFPFSLSRFLAWLPSLNFLFLISPCVYLYFLANIKGTWQSRWDSIEQSQDQLLSLLLEQVLPLPLKHVLPLHSRQVNHLLLSSSFHPVHPSWNHPYLYQLHPFLFHPPFSSTMLHQSILHLLQVLPPLPLRLPW